jgi:sarcosine oxidase, subunit beta
MSSISIPHFDVIIIGAGSVGTPAALFLARAGLKTLVIDRAASVGQESNKRAIGGVRATHSDPAKIRLCLRSLDIFSTWQKIYGDDIEWYPGGYVFAAYRQREETILTELLARQKPFGLNINWLDKQQLLEVVPDLNPNDLVGGTFSPEDGSASPLLAMHAFYRHAVRAGAVFNFNERAEQIIIRSGQVVAVKTDRGEYGTDVVVNAAGPGARQVSQLVGLEVPVTPDSHEAAITEPVARFLDPMVVDIRPLPGSSNFYFYQHLTGQIVFCITPSPSIWGEDVHETSEFLPMVARRLLTVMPRLMNIRVRRTWRGLYPMTPDGFPIVGYAQELKGFIQAVGMCGQGFMLGPGLGELLVRLIQDKLDESDQEILSILSPYRQFAGQEMLK